MTTPIYAHLAYLHVSPFLQDSPSPPTSRGVVFVSVIYRLFDPSLIIVVSKYYNIHVIM